MNTSRLQGFAAEARVTLMKAVRARLDAAMEPDSAARVDNSNAFKELNEEIQGNGGGEQGRAKTAERHAYRWFNRIIALRYMDANDFTKAHVVSGPAADDINALPEVLSAAKRGEFDEDVLGLSVGSKAQRRRAIEALLDGSKPSNDPQGEAYGLLLFAYCDYWHGILPFMFDDAGAADAILMPSDLLASDSILRKAVEVMTVADCVGDEGRGNVEIIGWLYQFYIAERKDEVMAGFKKSKKAGAAEIPAATQLFTPDWIVRYLVQNTVGRLWVESHPESRLWKNWEYYIPRNHTPSDATSLAPSNEGTVTQRVTGGETSAPLAPSDERTPGEAGWWRDRHYPLAPSDEGAVMRSMTGGETTHQPALPITTPEDLTVCDPACGSGHMLTYAFDLLYDIYDEAGYSANEIPALILKHNLFGMEIDERAANLAAFALSMKARGRYRRFFRKNRHVQPNIQWIEPVRFADAEVEELNDLYHVTFDADTWNTYQCADVYGSLIQPPTDLTNLATSLAPSDEGAPGEAEWGRDSHRSSALSDEGTVTQRMTGGETPAESNDPQGILFTTNTPNLQPRADTILTHTRYLARKYAVVVANPPYMGSGNMGTELKKYVADHYKDGKADLYSCFYYRYLSFTDALGLFGTVIGDTWMFIKSFEDMRRDLITNRTIESFVHIRDVSNHPDIFGANAAFVVSNGQSSERSVFIKLSQSGSDCKRSELLSIFESFREEWPSKERRAVDETRKLFIIEQHDFTQIPGSPIVYWLSDAIRRTFTMGRSLEEVAKPRVGLQTGNNERFIREWWEVSRSRSSFDCKSHEEAAINDKRWFPCNKGGSFRRWYGNAEEVINWEQDGAALIEFKPNSVIRNPEKYFLPSVSWSLIGSGESSFRYYPTGSVIDHASGSFYGEDRRKYLSILNSSFATTVMSAIAPTLNANVGLVGQIPFIASDDEMNVVDSLIVVSRSDWNSYEVSWGFASLDVLRESSPLSAVCDSLSAEQDILSLSQPAADSSLVRGSQDGMLLAERIPAYIVHCKSVAEEQRQREIRNNEMVADAYGVRDEVPCDVPIERVSLKRNPAFAYPKNTPAERDELMAKDVVKEIVSYAVGCMFGRYSLDKPGLVLASQGETIEDYLAQVPQPSFMPDADNVIPITDEEWFEDDIVTRFRDFLAVACGERHLNENIAYMEEVLGKPLRKYFATDFYDDHVSMYKNRPIYWMYSSAPNKKGAFRALVYLHRYTPATTNGVLKCLREFTAKLNAQSEALLASVKPAEVRKGEKLRTAIKECVDYERDTLYPLATRNLPLDLDDGVLVNYLRLGKSLRPIPALEKKRPTVQSWTWPHYRLEHSAN